MEKFDIYWANFTYEENSELIKRRPVLLLDVDILLPIAKITSKEKRTEKDYTIKNWKEAGLDKPSVIRFNKTKWLISSALAAEDKIGHLDQEDIKEIKRLKLVEKLLEARQQSALKSNGVYSVLHKKWIKEPVAQDIPELDQEAFDKLFNEWDERYKNLINNNPTIESIEKFIEDIYDLRKNSIANDGEYGLGNLVFKECRNLGYIDNLKDIKAELKTKELSLEGLK